MNRFFYRFAWPLLASSLALFALGACDRANTTIAGASPVPFLPIPSVRIEPRSGRVIVDGSYGVGLNAVVSSEDELILRADGTVWKSFGQISGLKNVASLSAQNVVLRDGSLWSWVRDQDGIARLTQIEVGNPVAAIISRGETLLVVLTDGRVMSRQGTDSLGFVAVDAVLDVEISLDGKSFYALRTDGTVWGWGDGTRGQLGSPVVSQVASPIPLAGLTNIKEIAAGKQYLLALKQSGAVVALGANTFGQLGDGSFEDAAAPVDVAMPGKIIAIGVGDDDLSVAVAENGDVLAWGKYRSKYYLDEPFTNIRRVDSLTGITSIASKTTHSLALKADGTVWAWGDNDVGQLGSGSAPAKSAPAMVENLTDVKQITAGHGFSVALRNDGTVWVWGHVFRGSEAPTNNAIRRRPVQLDMLSNIVAIDANFARIFALDSSGDVWWWEVGENGIDWYYPPERLTAPTKLEGLHDVTAIYAGGPNQSVFKRSDGTYWQWWSRASPPALALIAGLEDAVEVEVADEIYYRRADGTLRSLSPDSIRDDPASKNANIRSFTVGYGMGISKDNEGKSWIWGAYVDRYIRVLGQYSSYDTGPFDLTPVVGNIDFAKTAIAGHHVVGLDPSGNVWTIGDGRSIWDNPTGLARLGDHRQGFSSVPVKVRTLASTFQF